MRFTGTVDIANPRSEIGSTLNPAVRFFIFDAAPDLDRLLPPGREVPMAALTRPAGAGALVDRVFWQALARAPSAAERRIALRAVPTRPAVAGWRRRALPTCCGRC